MANEKDDKDGVIEALFERAKDYAETRGDLFKLKAIKKAAEIGSSVISAIVTAILFLVFLLMLNIGLGFWVGELLGSTYLGFFALAGFYLIVGIIVNSSSKKILKGPLADSIIKKIND